MKRETWYVKVVEQYRNSVGQLREVAYRITFHCFRDAFEYFTERRYILGCTEYGERLRSRHKQWLVSEPTQDMPLLGGYRYSAMLDDWELDG